MRQLIVENNLLKNYHYINEHDIFSDFYLDNEFDLPVGTIRDILHSNGILSKRYNALSPHLNQHRHLPRGYGYTLYTQYYRYTSLISIDNNWYETLILPYMFCIIDGDELFNYCSVLFTYSGRDWLLKYYDEFMSKHMFYCLK